MGMPGTTTVLAPIAPTHESDLWASHKARYGHGGYRSVTTYAERDGIIVSRRESGMVVFVREDRTSWRLQEDLITWEAADHFVECEYNVLGTSNGAILINNAGEGLGTDCIAIRYVRIDGDTMTGPLILSEEPEPGVDPPLQAAPYQWVLDQIGSTQAKYLIHNQLDPVSHLLLPHTFGRPPMIQLLDNSGRVMSAQVKPTPADVDITFEITTAFTAILT
jgi:hypothetical protein